jgi:hypothetical protein
VESLFPQHLFLPEPWKSFICPERQEASAALSVQEIAQDWPLSLAPSQLRIWPAQCPLSRQWMMDLPQA